jgi:hypothetical protein
VKIEWLYLLAALALLLPPAPFSSGVQKSLFSLRRNQFADALAAARVWQNWLDLVRAAAGVYLLTQHAIVTDGLTPGAEMQALAIKAGILILVLVAQTVRIFRTVQLLAPLFYLSGMTLVLGGNVLHPDYYYQGIFAVVVGWLFAIGGKQLAYQLPSMAVALAVAGYVLGLGVPLLLNCALILIPPILGTLFRRKLLFAASTAAST